MRRLLALVESPEHACYRYRLAAFRDTLAEAGWELEPLVLARGDVAFFAQTPQIAAADAVVLLRRLLPWWRRWMLRKNAKVLLYDIDDAVFLRDSNAGKSPHSSRRQHRFRASVRLADAVTAGNRFLMEQAAPWTDAARVVYFPTAVELERYPAALHQRRDGRARLAWIGSRSTLPSLALAREGLAAASARLNGLELRIICDGFPALEGVRTIARPWAAETEADELAAADIGVSWLPDHPWSLGKCGLKVLQYMAAGLPVVANPIGVHCEMIRHGQTGFLASTPSQWAEAIARLAASPELRATMGHAARRMVAEQYNAPSWAAQFIMLLNRLSSAPSGRETVGLGASRPLTHAAG